MFKHKQVPKHKVGYVVYVPVHAFIMTCKLPKSTYNQTNSEACVCKQHGITEHAADHIRVCRATILNLRTAQL